jgi:ATP-binding cassette subfamily B protein
LRTALALVWQAGRAQAALLVVLSALLGVAPVFAAWMVKVFADRLDGGGLVLPALGIAASTLVLLAIPATLTYLRTELERRVGLLVNERLFTAINAQTGLRSFENPVFHNRLQLAQQGGETAPPVVLAMGMTLVESGVTLIGFAGSLLVVSPLVALLALAAAAPGLVVERRLARAQADLAFSLSPVDRRKLFYGNLQTDERAAKEIRLFGLGGHFLTRMLGEFRTLNDASRRMDRTVLSRQLVVGVLTAALGGVALLLVAGQAADGELGAGDVFVVVAAIAGVQTASSGMVTTAGHLLEALLLLGHYRDFLADAGERERGGEPCPPLREAIELRDVWFRYSPEHPWVLEGVSMRIEAGEAVALVGLNGAGKSTLVKLLCRLYDPERGAITWDGADVRGFDVASLRRRVATVFQDFMEYDLSAAENVALGDVDRLGDRAAVEVAAAGAGVDAVLRALPRGYDTLLSRIFADGEDAGVELSGGQWQRIAVARMLMRPDPELLILDEPSAGLDAEAEHELHQRLLARREGTTSVLISHRLSAVAMAERIIVLSGGRVLETGSHAELMAAEGEYARLFSLQAAGYRDA